MATDRFESQETQDDISTLESDVTLLNGKILFTRIATVTDKISIDIPNAITYGCHLVCFVYSSGRVEKTVADIEIFVNNSDIHVGKNQGDRSFVVNSANITNGKLVLDVTTESGNNYGYAVVFA